jgi:predicted nucleotidyltransferase
MHALDKSLDITPQQLQVVRQILQRHVPCYEVWAFGSRVRNRSRRFSDLDLAIISRQPLELAKMAALRDDFSQSDLPWKVDVIDWANTGDEFRTQVEQQRVIIQSAA